MISGILKNLPNRLSRTFGWNLRTIWEFIFGQFLKYTLTRTRFGVHFQDEIGL